MVVLGSLGLYACQVLFGCSVGYLLGLLGLLLMFTRLTVLGKDERMSVLDTVRTRRGLEVLRPSTVRLSSMPQGQDMLAIAIRVHSRYSNGILYRSTRSTPYRKGIQDA